MAELDLEVIRKEIDKVDRQLAAILEARLGLVMQVAEYKKAKGMPVKDKAREAKVVDVQVCKRSSSHIWVENWSQFTFQVTIVTTASLCKVTMSHPHFTNLWQNFL